MLVEYHRNMLSDKPRNKAFHRALEKLIVKGKTTVADIGSGTGVLGFMASRLGAKDVYLYEQAGVMELSQRLAKANKIRNCHFFHGHSTEAEDPPMVDVIVTETLGNYALEENIIATVEDAKRFLKPGGTIIPQTITHFVAPVVNDRFHKELMIWDDVGYGLDFSAAKEMSLNNIYVRTFKNSDLLKNSAKAWDTVDLRKKNSSTRRGGAEWVLESNTEIYGFAVWWECGVLPGITLSTAPGAPKTHWEQLYFPASTPLQGRRGDRLSVDLTSISSYEAGTDVGWRIALHKAKGGEVVRQSFDLRKGFI